MRRFIAFVSILLASASAYSQTIIEQDGQAYLLVPKGQESAYLSILNSPTADVAYVQPETSYVPQVVTSTVTSPSPVCPQCGKVHAVSSRSYGGGYSSPAAGGARDVLGELNRWRAQRGLYALQPDPNLFQSAAARVRLVAQQCRRRLFHPRGNWSYNGARAEGVGKRSGGSGPPNACYTDTRSHRYAGMASYTSGGQTFYCLHVR